MELDITCLDSLPKPCELFRLNLLLEIHTECVERFGEQAQKVWYDSDKQKRAK